MDITQTPANSDKIPAIEELAPIAASKRIDVMDMLRGFALIGILLMNIEWFNRAIAELGSFDPTLKGVDWSAGWLVRLFVEGKFYKLFSLLFGMGFAVMLIRAQEAGRPFGAWFSRRMFFLYLFGLAHMIFLWNGDILHDYAVGGAYLLAWVFLTRTKWFKMFSEPRWFLRLGLLILALPMLWGIGAGMFYGNLRSTAVMEEVYEQRLAYVARAEAIKQDSELSASLLEQAEARKEAGEDDPEIDEDEHSREEIIEFKAGLYFVKKHQLEERVSKEQAAFSQDGYWTATAFRAENTLKFLQFSPMFALIISFPLFLIGYWFIASGVLREPRKHLNLFKTMAWVGILPGLFFSICGLLIIVHPATEKAEQLEFVSNFLFFISQYLLTAGYLGAFILAALTQTGHRLMTWMAPMGRMALTNYIMNSVVLSSVFYGYAGGLFGQISRAPQMGIVLVIIVVQALFSIWWLKHFRFGPLEWLWRSLTYLKVQPFRL